MMPRTHIFNGKPLPVVVVLTEQGTRRVLNGIAGSIFPVVKYSQVPGGQLMAHVRDGAQNWSLGEGDYLFPRAAQ